MYGKSLKMKQEKQAREMQEQLAFDLKILEQLLEESRNEAMEQVQRKVSTLYSLIKPGGITQWIPDDALRHHLVTTR